MRFSRRANIKQIYIILIQSSKKGISKKMAVLEPRKVHCYPAVFLEAEVVKE